MASALVRGALGKSGIGLDSVIRAACILAVLGAVGVNLAGCNTVKGVGRDIEAIGQGGQDIIDGKN